MSKLEHLLEELTLAPEDWKLRSILADWFEDNGKLERAECLRWMVRHHKRPYHGQAGGATWFNQDTISGGLGDPESDIPGAIYSRLEGGKETANHKSFASLRLAEESFQTAWERAREEGWKPNE